MLRTIHHSKAMAGTGLLILLCIFICSCTQTPRNAPTAITPSSAAKTAIEVPPDYLPEMAAPVASRLKPESRYLEIHTIGQNELVANLPSSFRVLVYDSRGRSPIPQAEVCGTLLGAQGKRIRTLFKAKTDERGTISRDFRLPSSAAGPCIIEISAKAGEATKEQSFHVNVVKAQEKLNISTDKPLYQPGQTIHIRTMALVYPTLKPIKDRKFTLEVFDSKGNKIMREEKRTSRFGITSADFTLGREILMGDYTIKASSPSINAEKKVAVRKYTLPRFKVALSTDRKYFKPGEKIEGTVNARYFFGKPTADADVTVEITATEDTPRKLSELKGKTDKEGFFRFSYDLPATFQGAALEENRASITVDAHVTDVTKRKESVSHHYTLGKYPLSIQIIPESGTLVPGVENTVYVLTNYPDGTSAECTVDVHRGNDRKTLATDASGCTSFTLTPRKSETVQIMAKAEDRKGNKSERSCTFTAGSSDEALLLKADRTLYAPGDRVDLTVSSTMKNGTVYVDLLEKGHPFRTLSLDVKDGRGAATFVMPPDICGMLTLKGYFISPYAGIVADSRAIYCAPANLNIRISLDRESYRPGQDASLTMAVTDRQGAPAPSALGIDIVDESLFALSERRPGMEKIKNLVPDELLGAPYTIGGAALPDLIALAGEQRSQTFSKLILAKAPQQDHYSVNIDSYASEDPELRERMKAVFTSAQTYYRNKGEYPQSSKELMDAQLLNEKKAKDPWGHFFIIRAPKKGVKGGIPDLYAYKNYCSDGSSPAIPAPNVKMPVNAIDREERIARPGKVEVKPVDDMPRINMPGKVMPIDRYRPGRSVPDRETALYLPSGYEEQMKPNLAPEVSVIDISQPDVLCLGADGVEGTADDYDLRAAVIADLPNYYALAVHACFMTRDKVCCSKGTTEERAQQAMPAMAERETKMGVPPPAPAAKMDNSAGAPAPAEPVKIRDFFPETLLSRPEIITDNRGMATLGFPLADSITTWRVAASANSEKGQIGSTAGGIKVFQDFFIDLNLPVKLTQGDEVSIPVAVYNYLPQNQTVSLSLEKMPWFELKDGDASRQLSIGKDEVKAVSFRVKAKSPGLHKFTVTARGSSLSDAISKTIEVEPDGKKFILSRSAVLNAPGTITAVNIPQGAVPGGSSILLTIYPSPVSGIIQGMDTIFRMPGGCFEQTSSITYPNVLVLDYLKSTKTVKPDVEKQAKSFINEGYQKILSYEIAGGGFQVWGQAPATRVLSAYGLMELSDMSRVSTVDPAVLARTRKWLLSQRNSDGSWTPDASFAHAEQWGTIQSQNIPTTAYITWALAESGCRNEIAQSLAYLKKNTGQINNPYILGLCANAFLAANLNDPEGHRLLNRLAKSMVTKGSIAFWNQEQSLYSQGSVASVETTALIIYSMMKSHSHSDLVTKGLAYIISCRDSNGLWASTQATIFAMRTLLLQQHRSGSDSDFAGHVIINGRSADSFTVTKKNCDVFKQIELKKFTREGNNTIEIAAAGRGECTYQLTGIYYLPWNRREAERRKELGLTVEYDRKEVKTQENVTCSFEAKNLRSTYAPMVMVEVGTPPGFDVMTEDLDALVKNKRIQKYETARGKVVIYLDGIDKGGSLKGSYHLMARYPMKAKTPVSTTYLYYNPEVNGTAEPVILTVI